MSAFAIQDDLIFASEDEPSEKPSEPRTRPWKIIIVDDVPEIHDITILALEDFSFADRGLEFLSAYSGAEAKKLIAAHPDAAMVLLDVVMENDHAGLDVARYVREELGNKSIRIVLRTGQPGQAPERKIIADYDINDYKEKTELTFEKLYTLMYSCLRSYRDITVIESNKRGLEKVIEASASIFETHSLEHFTHGVMEQLTSLLMLDRDAVYCKTSGLAARCDGNADLKVVAGTGQFADAVGKDLREIADSRTLADLQEAIAKRCNLFGENRYTGYFGSNSGAADLFHVTGIGSLNDLDRNLIELFSKNVGIAFENLHLNKEIEDTQKEIVHRLGEAVETRSKETGNHIRRVAEYSKLLALGCGLDSAVAEIIRLASPLHDIGKIGIPDAILNKPGKHSPEEWEIMKTHAQLGYDMLEGSERPILRAGALIALEHHEKWSGEGYPNGKKGADIHIYGRITALADVFDALGSDRCYKKAWPLEKILDLLREERGRHFDPDLVDTFFARIDEFLAIRDAYPDLASAA